MHHLFGMPINASYVCVMENKILHYISLYSVDGPKIWFMHTNKKTYLLLSNLHLASEISNGSGKDGVVGECYVNGERQWRSCFIQLSKIKQIWREPDPNCAAEEMPEWERNENEMFVS